MNNFINNQNSFLEPVIGDIPAGWEYVRLGDVCRRSGGDIQTGPFGSQLHAADYVDVGVPSIMPQNIGDNVVIEKGISRISQDDARRLNRYLVRTGDIIYSRRGDVERRALIRQKENGWLCGTGCLRVRFGAKGPDSRYASYYLGHPSVREWIVRHAHGATMPNLNTSILSDCPFVIPPPDIQKSIVSILGSLDDLIETNRRTNETLEAMARAIFKDWFVDFGPVRAKAEGRAPYLAPEIWSLFPDALDDEDKPEGWGEKRIDDVLELAYGKALPASQRVHGPVPVYGSGGITGYHNVSLVDGPSIIVGRKGTVGSLYWEDRPFYPIDTVFYVVPKIELTYCFYLLETFGLHEMNTDAAVPGLNRSNVYRLTFPWASDDLMHAFGSLVGPIRQMISANNEESKNLSETRDFLLPKLMSGEIRVKDAEHLIQQAV